MNGIIKKKTEKGFGFIAIEGADDLFFHSNSLVDITYDELKEGDSVTFDKEQTQKGWNATNVKKV
jgi:cold shock protein